MVVDTIHCKGNAAVSLIEEIYTLLTNKKPYVKKRNERAFLKTLLNLVQIALSSREEREKKSLVSLIEEFLYPFSKQNRMF